MTDTPLLDWTPAHQVHSPTSKAAAEAIKPHIGPMHRKILTCLTDMFDLGHGGATDAEMQDILKMKESTQRPRRRELQQWGYILDSGRTRATQSGRQAVVWVVRS